MCREAVSQSAGVRLEAAVSPPGGQEEEEEHTVVGVGCVLYNPQGRPEATLLMQELKAAGQFMNNTDMFES